MVLPASPADPRAGAHPWLSRIGRLLHLGRDKVIILAMGGVPAGLGPLARALFSVDAGLVVCTRAPEVVRADDGALVLLIPRVEDVAWLNENRPLFAERGLRVVIWADDRMVLALQQHAPDFFDWISHAVLCAPADARERVPAFAVAGLTAGADVYPGIVWQAGNLDEAMAAAYPDQAFVRVSARGTYDELVAGIRGAGERWIIWVGVHELRDLMRVRWALAETDRRGRCIVEQPGCAAPGWRPASSRCRDVHSVAEVLDAEHGMRAALVALLVDLEPGAVALASKLEVTDEGALVARLACARDPGAELARVALEQGAITTADVTRWLVIEPPECAERRAVLVAGIPGDMLGDMRAPVIRGLADADEVTAQVTEVRARTSARLHVWSQSTDAPGPDAQPDIEEVILWANGIPTAPPALPACWRTFAMLGYWIEAALRVVRTGDTWPERVMSVLAFGNEDAVRHWERELGLQWDADELPENILATIPDEIDPDRHERVIREAIASYEQHYRTREHPMVGGVLSMLAIVLRTRARDNEAEEVLREAIAIGENTYVGTENKILATCFRMLLDTLRNPRDGQQSAIASAEIFQIAQRLAGSLPTRYGRFYLQILGATVKFLREQGNPSMAEQLETAAEAYRRQHGL